MSTAIVCVANALRCVSRMYHSVSQFTVFSGHSWQLHDRINVALRHWDLPYRPSLLERGPATCRSACRTLSLASRICISLSSNHHTVAQGRVAHNRAKWTDLARWRSHRRAVIGSYRSISRIAVNLWRRHPVRAWNTPLLPGVHAAQQNKGWSIVFLDIACSGYGKHVLSEDNAFSSQRGAFCSFIQTRLLAYQSARHDYCFPHSRNRDLNKFHATSKAKEADTIRLGPPFNQSPQVQRRRQVSAKSLVARNLLLTSTH